jgi:hypothetical protein
VLGTIRIVPGASGAGTVLATVCVVPLTTLSPSNRRQTVALAVALAVALVALSPPERLDSFQAAGGGYRVGDRVAEITGVDFVKNQATLLVVVKDACPACAASMDFYKRLASSPRRAKLVVLSQGPPDALGRLLDTHEFEPDQALSTDARLRIDGTPTLYLVDRDRTVIQAWVGQLPTRQEHDVIRAIR